MPDILISNGNNSGANAVSDKDLDKIRSGRGGLTSAEARQRLAKFGLNALEEHRVGTLKRLIGYFWGPIPWMIEIAAMLSAALRHWPDFVIITALLAFNAAVGFWQEYKAANALAALKKELAVKSRVLRDGLWQEINAAFLVPGDIIRLKIGDIVPADAYLLDGEYLSLDQSSLTGESLPVDKRPGETVYSGSAVKYGDMSAFVTATAMNTLFGRTARLVEKAGSVSHFQKAVLTIGRYLIYVSLILVAILLVTQLIRGASLLRLLQFSLILTVASIPVAMPAVLSVTMALGALALSRQKAVVSKLESIEEIAGIDVLCCDKTGTLTQNRLTLGEPVVFEAADAQDLVLAAALASSSKDSGGMDAIDSAIMAELPDKTLPGGYTQISFIPFDPVRKRTEAKINNSLGRTFRVSKGAPQVILKIAEISADTQAKALKVIEEMAVKGYRTLGVARADLNGPWRFLGLLPLFDPPREDSARTIVQAKTHGIAVKMVTGDNLAIARETADKLGLGKEIVPADVFFNEIAGKQEAVLSQDAGKRIEAAAGFAQVFPEHKYDIVKALQERGHLVGMTGDGVNDAPALKQADVGIAVSGAADAARAAADLVLTAPGLNVIVNAVEEARRIFERMNSYSIYRIAETIRIMFFVVTAMIFFNFYPITTIMIILLAFFNDVPIMAIAYDNTWLDTAPVRWHMRRVLTVSTILGFVGTVSSFLLLLFFKDVFKFGINEIQTLIFLKLAVAGHLTLFIARTRRSFWTHPLPSPLLFWSAAITKLAATFLVVYPMGLLTPVSWGLALLVWAYALAWMFISDTVKVFVYRRLAAQTAP